MNFAHTHYLTLGFTIRSTDIVSVFRQSILPTSHSSGSRIFHTTGSYRKKSGTGNPVSNRVSYYVTEILASDTDSDDDDDDD